MADVVWLGAEWEFRPLLRAQLIEDGFEVIATDEWSVAWPWAESRPPPRLAIVDLKGLPQPEEALRELCSRLSWIECWLLERQGQFPIK